MRLIRNVFAVLVVFLTVSALFLFGMENSRLVSIKFLSKASEERPLAYFLFLAFVAGFILAGLLSLVELFRIHSHLRKARRMNELLEREVDALRNQPLFEEPPSKKISSTVEKRLMHEGQPEESVDQEASA